jgi:hypothetical protein
MYKYKWEPSTITRKVSCVISCGLLVAVHKPTKLSSQQVLMPCRLLRRNSNKSSTHFAFLFIQLGSSYSFEPHTRIHHVSSFHFRRAYFMMLLCHASCGKSLGRHPHRGISLEAQYFRTRKATSIRLSLASNYSRGDLRLSHLYSGMQVICLEGYLKAEASQY